MLVALVDLGLEFEQATDPRHLLAPDPPEGLVH